MDDLARGNGEVALPKLALGCWAFGEQEFWADQDDADSIATVDAALELGVTMFDTAESYGKGRSEEVLGRALAGRRSEALIATKLFPNNFARECVVSACERSLRHLQTDVIDLYQLHWPSPKVGLDETFEGLLDIHQRGYIRAIGVCNMGQEDLTRAVEEARRCGLEVVSNQLPYSLLWRAIEFGTADACRRQEVAMMAYSPLAQGLLTGKFSGPDEVPEERARTRIFNSSRPRAGHGEEGAEEEAFDAVRAVRSIANEAGIEMGPLALSWLLHQPGVATVVAGARRPEQIRETVAATELSLARDVIEALDAATLPLREKLGSNADMWRAQGRIK